jgi:primosomal replication protein N''
VKLPVGRYASGTAHLGLARWQRKRVQHQEFERRLVEMTRERKERLAQATGFAEQQNCIVK